MRHSALIRRGAGLIMTALTLLLPTSSGAFAQVAPYCAAGQAPSFSFGFGTLKAALGDVMGDPVTCEFADPNGTGDVQQRTTTGLAFWRKSTNTPTFTNGNEHWAHMPDGSWITWEGQSIDPPSVTPPPVPATVVPATAPPPPPPPPPPPAPAPTTDAPKSGDVLYQANWSSGTNGWLGPPSWKVAGGALVNTGQPSSVWRDIEWIAAPYEPDRADYAVEAVIQFLSTGNTANYPCGPPNFGVVVRAGSTGGYMGGPMISVHCFHAPPPRIMGLTDGHFYTFGSAEELAMPGVSSKRFEPDTQPHLYRLEARGITITLFIDGNRMADLQDARYTSPGQVGLWSDAAQVSVQGFKVLAL